MSWLTAVEAALDAAQDRAASPVPFFVRDDDAGWADDRLEALLDVAEDHGAVVDVAVIPAEVSTTLVRVLTPRAARGDVRLHQHGFAHVNHETVGRSGEFGASRTARQQAGDVARGRRLLLEAFGEMVEPVFTPPWNRCSAATVEAVRAAGLTVLSRDSTATRLEVVDPLVEVPVTLDWFGHRRRVRWTTDELGRRLADQVAAGGPVGVMLHHAVTDDDELGLVDELLALLARHPGAHATSLLGVAEQIHRGAREPSDGGQAASTSSAASIPASTEAPSTSPVRPPS